MLYAPLLAKTDPALVSAMIDHGLAAAVGATGPGTRAPRRAEQHSQRLPARPRASVTYLDALQELAAAIRGERPKKLTRGSGLRAP